MADPGTDGVDAAPAHEKHRNPWIWISAVLAIVVVGVTIWAVGIQSDNDTAKDELASTQQKLAATQEQLKTAQATPAPTPEPEDESREGRAILTAGAVAGITAMIHDLEDQLGATQQDLEAAEQDLEQTAEEAEEADQKATAAENQAQQAGDANEKAEAEADQAKAEVEAAESRAAIARDCARAYVTAIGQLFEERDPEDKTAEVRDQLQGVTAQCTSAFAE